MAGQLKTRIQALDAKSHLRRWLELEASEAGIKLTIFKPPDVANPGDDYVFQEGSGIFVVKDQLIGFIVGCLISDTGSINLKEIKTLLLRLLQEVADDQ